MWKFISSCVLLFFAFVQSFVVVVGDSSLASSSPIVSSLEKRSGVSFENHTVMDAGILDGRPLGWAVRKVFIVPRYTKTPYPLLITN